ncbi:MAG: RdgB/HAM1 family non-canonical purine NTP pyrophosphatase [Actinomycetota bacterium]
MEVVLATSNPGKVHEARAILAPSGLEIVTRPMWLGEVETGVTYLENARLKAAATLRMVHTAVLAEDAGLEVDALRGAPGVRSARFVRGGATAEENNAKLLRLLTDVPAAQRTARFKVVAVLLLTSGEEIVGEGVFEGSIATKARGKAGFGYDPIFIPKGMDVTAAELSDEDKNRISHRALALRAIAERFGRR